jgi:hypothetical protein
MNRPGMRFNQSKMESSLQGTALHRRILGMNVYVRIAAGSFIVASGLFLTSCAGESDVPSAYETGVPSAANLNGPTGPESGEGDFAPHP